MPCLTVEGQVPEPSKKIFTPQPFPNTLRKPSALPGRRPAQGPSQPRRDNINAITESNKEFTNTVAEVWSTLDECMEEEEETVECVYLSSEILAVIEISRNVTLTKGLCDTAATTNLMKLQLAKRLNLRVLPLVKPTKFCLAIDNGTSPSILTHFSSASINSVNPKIEFGSTFFKLAPLHVEYDIILGTPFLKEFELDVSLGGR